MNEILNAIVSNLTSVALIIILIFIFQLGNLCFGISQNVINLGEAFDINKVAKWALKTALTLAGTALLCIGITLIPFAITYIGITIPAEYDIMLDITLVLLVSFGELKAEATKCFDNYKKCIENL